MAKAAELAGGSERSMGPSLVLAIVGILLSQPILAATVRVESTPAFDFTRYKRYSWRTHPVFEKRPELSERYSVGIQLVKNAVNEHLMGRGYQSTQGPADFYITFFLTGEARQDVDVVYRGDAYGWGGWYGWSSMYYPSWTETVTTNYVEGRLCSISSMKDESVSLARVLQG